MRSLLIRTAFAGASMLAAGAAPLTDAPAAGEPAAPGVAHTVAAREVGRGARDTTVTLIHIGDLHGRLVPRPDARAPAPRTEGGLARVHTVVEGIRRRHPGRTLLVNVGDATQGSAEALFTRGQAIIDLLAPLRIDVFVPGNWDFLYGVDRFVEMFVGDPGRPRAAPWATVAANLYYATPDAGMRSPFGDLTGERVVPPFVVREVGGVRVGIIGLTTIRGPRALGAARTRGFMFTPGDAELSPLIARLRNREQVDIVVLASELELANNVRLAERTAGIDVVLSADMHELTAEPIVTATGTVIVEEGQDGAAVGELTLTVRRGRVAAWAWRSHRVDDTVAEDPALARRVAAARRPFLRGPAFDATRRNPINGALLGAPLDEVVGYTTVALHRAHPATHALPAVLEGSSHDLVADAIRTMAGADVALVRGFRFGTHVRPGPITRGDLYHFLPIGAQVARVDGVPGRVLLRQLEASAQGALDTDPRRWTGGWLAAVSGMTFAVDPYAPAGHRVRDVRLGAVPLDTTGAVRYSVAGLWFAFEPAAVSNCVPCATDGRSLELVSLDGGAPTDAVDVVARYLASAADSTVTPALPRVRATRPLPAPSFGFAELQPLRGAIEQRARAGQIAVPARH